MFIVFILRPEALTFSLSHFLMHKHLIYIYLYYKWLWISIIMLEETWRCMKFHFGVVAYAPGSILLQKLGFTICSLPGYQAPYCLSLLIAEQGRIFFKEMIQLFFTFYFHYCCLTIIWYICSFLTLQNSDRYFPFVCSPDLLSFFLLFTHILYHVYSRYATRCPRSFPHDTAWEASYDVQCHPCQRDPSCLQEVYARCNYTS